MKTMLKRIFINLIKFFIAFGLIYWLVNSGKIDMQLVKKSFQSPLLVFVVLFFMFIDHIFVALRWKIILETKSSNKLSVFNVFKANWIGIFFNSVLPGSVTGDLIKIFYVEKEDKNFTKKFLFASVFLDRLIGLFGLISLGGLSAIFYYQFLTEQSLELKFLVHINLLLFLTVLLSFAMLYFMQQLPLKIAQKIKVFSPLAKIIQKLEDIWNDLVMIRGHLLQVYFVSIIIQAIAIIIFWFVINYTLHIPLNITHAFSLMPIGLIAIAIPIAPAGLGVGHVVFLKLFSFIGINEGANLFNVYFIYVMMINLSGAIPYVLHKGENYQFKK